MKLVMSRQGSELAIAAVLLVVYISDQMYSSKHPNAGEGITSVQLIEEYISDQWSAGKTVRQV